MNPISPALRSWRSDATRSHNTLSRTALRNLIFACPSIKGNQLSLFYIMKIEYFNSRCNGKKLFQYAIRLCGIDIAMSSAFVFSMFFNRL